jgi:multiple sugar transport system permease protein
MAFVAPAVALVAVFLVIPAVWTLYLGFTNRTLTGVRAIHPEWVGLENYRDAVDDDRFWRSFATTIRYVLFSAVLGQAALGFTLAWMFRSWTGTSRLILELVVVSAWIIPGTVVAYLWRAFLAEDGTLNALIPGNPRWLIDHQLLSIVVFNVWRGTAFSMLLFGAAINSLPPSYLETARLAGASTLQQLTGVVLPSIKGYILTNLLLISLWTFNDFTPYMITKGGPEHRSETLPGYIYAHAINGGELGAGAAVSVIMLDINLVIALFCLRLLRERSGGRKKRRTAPDDTQGPAALIPSTAGPVGVQKGVGS